MAMLGLIFVFMRGGGKGERRGEYDLISRETTGYWNHYSIPSQSESDEGGGGGWR